MTKKTWTFLTNHSQVLLCIVRNSAITTREIALEVGITERAVQGIIHDLRQSGYINVFREGRNNRYELNESQPMRHPAQRGRSVFELLETLAQI